MPSRRRCRLLLLTPPLLQTNTPYPATMHLAGYLRGLGLDVRQCDLSIKVVRDVLCEYGDETTDELLEFLGGGAPIEAKRNASEAIEALALRIRDEIDPDFGFSRYAEHLCRAVTDFADLERRVRRRGVMDKPLARHLKKVMDEVEPTIVGVTCPFPGTLVGAFKVARWVRRHHPGVRLVLGGGYVATELREMTAARPYAYFDEFMLDEGYGAFARMMGVRAAAVPTFVRPSYDGIDWGEYFDVVETDNFVTGLWSAGKWVKLVMARGCYWHKCAFCDVRLPYISRFEMPRAAEIVDAIAEHFPSPSLAGVHFVDEAMPPALVSAVCDELLRREIDVAWWGNIRFDAAFTPALARKMAKAGCIAVTGGLECANDRLLKLMNKGITLASAERVLKAFRAARVFVHAYLMYDFPTETKKEQKEAERYVRSLARRGLIQSCYWHRFALTVHSPIARDAGKFGIIVKETESNFARNELEYVRTNRPRDAAS
ncbi:MAG: radical SAM protein [Kiritimatiellae bacterium]|nr:radical SAM protein [Kiritimatiellia bacterium]